MVIWFGRLNGWYSQVYSCVFARGDWESMSAWGRHEEEGKKRGSVNNREGKWSKARQATWWIKIQQKGTADERQSWGLMQNRPLTLLLDPWPSLSLRQEVRPSADRKHSSNLHTCGSRSYLYPIIVPRFIGAFMKRLLCNCGGVCGKW